MGVNVSKQSNESISNIVNQTMTDISSEINNEVSTITKSYQIMRIKIKGLKTHGGDLNISQKASVSVTSMLENSNELSNVMANKMTTKIKKELEVQAELSNKKLNLGQVNTSIQDNLSVINVQNIIKTAVSTTINNKVQPSTFGGQNLEMESEEIDTGGGNYNLSQENLISVIAKNISNNIVTNVLKNVVDVDLEEKLKAKAKLLNDGVNINMFAGIIMIIVLIIGAGYLSVKGGGAKKISKGVTEGVLEGAQNNPQAQKMMKQVMGGGQSNQQQYYQQPGQFQQQYYQQQPVQFQQQQPGQSQPSIHTAPPPDSFGQTPVGQPQFGQTPVGLPVYEPQPQFGQTPVGLPVYEPQPQFGQAPLGQAPDNTMHNAAVIGGLTLAAIAAIGAVYKLYYLPAKQKIKDTYDTSYLKDEK
jgi:hypothetical protein